MGKCFGKCCGKQTENTDFFYISRESQELHEIKNDRKCITSLNNFIRIEENCAIGYLSGNKLMLVGGLNPLNEKLSESYIIQIEPKLIRTLSFLPYGTEGGFLHEYKEWVYYLGGKASDIAANISENPPADLLRYHLSGNYWEKITSISNDYTSRDHLQRNIVNSEEVKALQDKTISLNRIEGFSSILYRNFLYIIGGRVIDEPDCFITKSLKLNLDNYSMEVTNFQLPYETLNPFCCRFQDKILILQCPHTSNVLDPFIYEFDVTTGFNESSIPNFPEPISNAYPAFSNASKLRVLGSTSWYRLRNTDNPHWKIIPNSLPVIFNGLGFQPEVLPRKNHCSLDVPGLSVNLALIIDESSRGRMGRPSMQQAIEAGRGPIQEENEINLDPPLRDGERGGAWKEDQEDQEDLDNIHIQVPRRLTPLINVPPIGRNPGAPRIDSPNKPESGDDGSDQEILIHRRSEERKNKSISEAEKNKKQPQIFPKYTFAKSGTEKAMKFENIHPKVPPPFFPQSKPDPVLQISRSSSNSSESNRHPHIINFQIHKKADSDSVPFPAPKQFFSGNIKCDQLNIEYSQNSSSDESKRSSSDSSRQGPRPAQKIIRKNSKESFEDSGSKVRKPQNPEDSNRTLSDIEGPCRQNIGFFKGKPNIAGPDDGFEIPEFPPELFPGREGFRQEIQSSGFPVPRKNLVSPLNNSRKDSDASKESSDIHESMQKISKHTFSCSENSITPNNSNNTLKSQENNSQNLGIIMEEQKDILIRDRELEDLSNSSNYSSNDNITSKDEISRRNLFTFEEEGKLCISKEETNKLIKVVCNALQFEQPPAEDIAELLVCSKIMKFATLPQLEFFVGRLVPDEESFSRKDVRRIGEEISKIFRKNQLSEEQIREIQESVVGKNEEQYSNKEIAGFVIAVVKCLILLKV